MASDASALRLGWRIQSLLYQWEDYPESISVDWILKSIHEVVEHESLEPSLPRYSIAFQRVGSHRWPAIYSPLLPNYNMSNPHQFARVKRLRAAVAITTIAASAVPTEICSPSNSAAQTRLNTGCTS